MVKLCKTNILLVLVLLKNSSVWFGRYFVGIVFLTMLGFCQTGHLSILRKTRVLKVNVQGYMHTYVHACVDIHAYTHTRTHTYIHTYIHTCIHTYTHRCIYDR